MKQILTTLSDPSLYFALLATISFAVMWMNSKTFHQKGIFKDCNPLGFFGSHQDKRKYKHDSMDFPVPAPDNWYYRFYDLKHKERFPLSSTALVFLTDAFHFFQWLAWHFVALAVHHESFLGWLTVRLSIALVWFVIFEIILKKR